VFWSGVTIVSLLLLLLFLAQLPTFQTYLTQKAFDWLSERTDNRIRLEKISISWFDELKVDGLEIYDRYDSLMISIPEMFVDVNVAELPFQKQGLTLDAVRISYPKVHLIKHNDSSYINITQFIQGIKALSAKKDKPKGALNLKVGRIKLDHGLFSLNDRRKDSILNRFDYTHFQFDSLNGDFSDFEIKSDSVLLDIDKLVASDPSGYLDVNHLETHLNFNSRSLALTYLDLKTKNSTITDTLILRYSSPSNLSYFIDSVDFEVHLKDALISSKDISAFATAFKKVDDVYKVSGYLNGKVGRLSGQQLSVEVGRVSRLAGSLYMTGLPKVDETFIDLNIDRGRLRPQDLRQYLGSLYPNLVNIGTLGVQGEFLGFVNDFVANAEFYNGTSRITSDINIKVPDNVRFTKYRGSLGLDNFDLRSILNNQNGVKEISLNGQIEGVGITLPTASFSLDSEISSVSVNDYVYSDIKTNGQFADQFFNGNFEVNDPNLIASGVGLIDFRDNRQTINGQIVIDTIRLLPINIAQQNISAKGTFDIDVASFKIDSLQGNIKVYELELSKDENVALIDTMIISSKKLSDGRLLTITSDAADLSVDGDYLFSNVYSDFSRLYQEYLLNINNNSEDITQYYSTMSVASPKEYDLTIDVMLKDINPLINLFTPDLEISRDVRLEGSFQHGHTSILSFYSRFDSLSFNNKYFIDNEVELTASKVSDSTSVLGMLYVASKLQDWGRITETQNTFIEAIWDGQKIDFRSNIDQEALDNYALIEGNVYFLKDTTSMIINPSSMQAFGNQWRFNQHNEVRFYDGDVQFDSLILYSDREKLFANGVLTDSTDKKLELHLEHFDLRNIQSLLPIDLSGIVNGSIYLADVFDQPSVESNVRIDQCYIEEFLVGDIQSLSQWEDKFDRFNLGFFVTRDDQNIIQIDGYFRPNESQNQLDLTAEIRGANLNIAQPFITTRFSNFSGFVDGYFGISGSLDYPILQGQGKLTEGTAKVNYLNTNYSFEGAVIFDANEIGVRQLNLLDQDGNQAQVNGGIFHDGFRDFVLDLSADLDAFQVLNTTVTDNELYYGTAYGTGRLNMLGALSNLTIAANATTNRGTRIFIPLNSTASIEQEEYISFVDFTHDSIASQIQSTIEKEVDLSGIKLDFDLEITNEAYCELIFDIKSGDIIRGRGNGNLKLQIDTKGDFNMFGDFEIETGAYNFTLYNIINKEFEIENGSRISWYGDPYGAILNIDAKYNQLASLAPLVNIMDEESLNSPELRRNYPAAVNLTLKDEMLSPEIEFGIEISDYPDNIVLQSSQAVISLNAVVNAFQSRISADEQELKRQVFSLIILKRFSPENSFSVGGGQTIGSSVSEFVSNQLSYWITQVDENLEIDVDLNSLDSDALNTFQLRLAYTFFDGRLRVSRDGGFTNTDGNTSDVSAIIGDWTLEYLLTQDGKFRAKMYNRTDQNAFTQINQNNTETGFSIQYIRSFDQLKEIVKEVKANQVPAQSTDDISMN